MRYGGQICVAVLMALATSACTGTAQVRSVSVEAGRGLPKIPGSYAAYVQTGGWQLNAESGSFTCSFWSFDADVNASYAAAMKEGLQNSLENVRFVGAPLTASDIAAEGLDAQVVVHQGNATSQFGVQNAFFVGTAITSVSLDAIIAVVTADGLTFQQTVHGQGHASDTVFTCNVIADALGEAASDAVRDTVEEAILYIREGVRARQTPPTTEILESPAS